MTQIWKYIHLNASCRKYKRTNTHARMSHVIHLNTSCRTCGWVMSRILMRHLTPQNESQRKRVTQMSNVSGWVTMLMRMSHTEPFCFCYENLCRDTFVVTDSWLIRDSFVTHSRASQCERVTTHIFTPQNKSRRMSHDDVWLILIVTHSGTPQTESMSHHDAWLIRVVIHSGTPQNESRRSQNTSRQMSHNIHFHSKNRVFTRPHFSKTGQLLVLAFKDISKFIVNKFAGVLPHRYPK